MIKDLGKLVIAASAVGVFATGSGQTATLENQSTACFPQAQRAAQDAAFGEMQALIFAEQEEGKLADFSTDTLQYIDKKCIVAVSEVIGKKFGDKYKVSISYDPLGNPFFTFYTINHK